MIIQPTLVSLKEALQQPFIPETIQFLPKEIRQEGGKFVCRALPYANKRVYEDRLNELAYGEWSTPSLEPYTTENKLIIPVSVVILGVTHTDYGEAYITVPGKNGTAREDDNTATEAYSQGFRRACAKFLLGRYLYDLPTPTLPYDPKTRQIALSRAERIAWVEKLYIQHGLLPRGYGAPAKPVTPSLIHARPQLTTSVDLRATPQPSPLPAVPHTKAPLPTSYPNDTFLDWVATQVERDSKRIQGICEYYKVTILSQLTPEQRKELTKRLRKQASKKQQQEPTTI